MSQATAPQRLPISGEIDVAIVGAGFGGMYMLHRLRGLGLSAVVFDVATGVGGTWTGTAIPAPAAMWRACSIHTHSPRNCSRNGNGAKYSPASRKFSATPISSPTAWTCAAT